MDNELEVIRDQMQDTRASLADKIEALEDKLGGTIKGATEAVAHTVEAVEETVEAVKDTFNLKKQVERHPWLMVGGAVTLGCLGSYLLGSSSRAAKEPEAGSPRGHDGHNGHNGHSTKSKQRKSSAAEEEGPFAEGLKLLKGLALGSLLGVLREVLTQTLPSSLVDDAAKAVDDLTVKLGGKPLGSGQQEEQLTRPQGAEPGGEKSDEKSNNSEMGRTMGTTPGESQAPLGGRHRR